MINIYFVKSAFFENDQLLTGMILLVMFVIFLNLFYAPVWYIKKNYFLSYSGILCRIAKKIFLLDFEVERKYSYRHSVPNFELQYNYATPNRSFKITCKFKKEQKMNKKIMPF